MTKHEITRASETVGTSYFDLDFDRAMYEMRYHTRVVMDCQLERQQLPIIDKYGIKKQPPPQEVVKWILQTLDWYNASK